MSTPIVFLFKREQGCFHGTFDALKFSQLRWCDKLTESFGKFSKQRFLHFLFGGSQHLFFYPDM